MEEYHTVISIPFLKATFTLPSRLTVILSIVAFQISVEKTTTGLSFANIASRKVSISLRCPLRRAHSASIPLTRSAALWKRSVRLLYRRFQRTHKPA